MKGDRSCVFTIAGDLVSAEVDIAEALAHAESIGATIVATRVRLTQARFCLARGEEGDSEVAHRVEKLLADRGFPIPPVQ